MMTCSRNSSLVIWDGIAGVDGSAVHADGAIQRLFIERFIRVKRDAVLAAGQRLAGLREFTRDIADQRKLGRFLQGVALRRLRRRKLSLVL